MYCSLLEYSFESLSPRLKFIVLFCSFGFLFILHNGFFPKKNHHFLRKTHTHRERMNFSPVKDWDLFHPHFRLPKKHRPKHHFLTKKTVFLSVGKLRQFPHTRIFFLEIFFFGIRIFLFYAETAVFPHRHKQHCECPSIV